VGVQGEVSVQKDIYKTVEVLKAKIKQDKKGKINKHVSSFVFLQTNKKGKVGMEGRKLPVRYQQR
jgi:hypothetical protein